MRDQLISEAILAADLRRPSHGKDRTDRGHRVENCKPAAHWWEAILPEMCLGMPAELEAVDRLLDDAAFFEPFRGHFHAALGRLSVPIETYLRLMFLKYRYRLGF